MKTYHRHPKETSKAYHAFCVYRDMGLERSMAKVAEKLGKSTPLMERWAKKFTWTARVKDYDNDMDEISRKAQEEEIKKLTEKRIQVARGFQAVGMAKLQEVKEQLDKGEKPRISMNDAIKAYDYGLIQEIRASGLTPDRTDLPIVKIELVHSNGNRKHKKD